VIPARLRRALGLRAGNRLVLRLEGDRIVIEKREKLLTRLRKRFEKIPREVDLAEELIAERRKEAEREVWNGRGVQFDEGP